MSKVKQKPAVDELSDEVSSKRWQNIYSNKEGKLFYGQMRFESEVAAQEYSNKWLTIAEKQFKSGIDHEFLCENGSLFYSSRAYTIQMPVKE